MALQGRVPDGDWPPGAGPGPLRAAELPLSDDPSAAEAAASESGHRDWHWQAGGPRRVDETSESIASRRTP